MTNAHISTILPIKNRVLTADNYTSFLTHYDLTENDVFKNIKSIGQKTCLEFDGSTYINIDDTASVLSTGDDFTFSCWFNTTYRSSLMHGSVIFSAHDSSGINLIRIGISDTGGIFYSGASGGDVSSSGSYADGMWHQLVVTVNGVDGTPHVYIDGVEDTGLVGTQIQWSNAAYMSIGQEYDGGGGPATDFYRGKLFGIKIYKDILENIESQQNSIRESSLIGYWKLDEGEGWVAHDSSGFHNDGLIEGNSLWGSGNSIFTLRAQEGKFGGAIAIEDETINLSLNPTFENLENWKLSSNAVEHSFTWNGEWAKINVSKTEVGMFYFANQDISRVTPANTPITFSVKFKNDRKGTFALRLAMWDSVSGAASQQPMNRFTLDGSGIEKTYSVTAVHTAESNKVRLDILAGSYYSGLSDVDVEFKNAQLEEKDFATSFTYNSRERGLLGYNVDVNDWARFTFSAWVKTHTYTGWRMIGGAWPKWYFAYFTGTSDNLRFSWWENGVQRSFSTGPVAGLDSNEWNHVAFTYDKLSTTCKIYVNGNMEGMNTTVDLNETVYGPLGIGTISGEDPSYPFNGLIDEVRIDNVVRTDEEILAWYMSNSPFWPRGIYRKSY